ncbi:Uncharacterised protein [Klebsiella pneumoniae]|uniref:Uncharacterized protein n=1 Tax=Klebsiella pneumoniae TaxID=573 RepID=A0A2X3IU92_KLEPN|nr:Uncharacterised protein [Klebsiella pneumoniae]
MAASPAGRHHHSLVIKLPVVTADIEVVAGIVFKVGRQPVTSRVDTTHGAIIQRNASSMPFSG